MNAPIASRPVDTIKSADSHQRGANALPMDVVKQNQLLYESYYTKPWWWFRLRYDTQVKRKTILWLLRAAGLSRQHLRSNLRWT